MWLKNHLIMKILCSIGSHTCTSNINKGIKNKGDAGGAGKEETEERSKILKTET
jgi:hypothetical protein